MACVLLLGACQAKDESSGPAPRRVVYKTVGTRELTLNLDYPPRWQGTDRRPAVVFFFGGGWNRGSVEQFQPQARYFAQRGMVCVRVDYRIVAKGALPERSVDDALDAMRWVRGHAGELGIDPDRMVAAGGSAGGLLAACTFFVPPPEDGVSHRPNALLLFNPRLSAGSRSPDRDEMTRRNISPMFLARRARNMVPALLVVGSRDERTLGRVRRFVHDVENLGAPVQLEIVPGQAHGFFNYMPWLATTTERADAFFQEIGYLGPEPKVELPSEDALVRPEDRVGVPGSDDD